MTILSAAEIASITSDIQDIIGDDVLSTTITYMQTGTTVSSWDPTSGVIPAMYTESSVSAFKGSYSLDEIEKSGGLIEFENVKFIIMTNDIDGVLSVDDMIRESASIWQSAVTYQIKAINKDPLNICYFLRVNRVGI